MRKAGKLTRYTGVQTIGRNLYRVRAKVKDPRTGKKKEVDQLIEASGTREAAAKRAALIAEARAVTTVEPNRRMRVGEYARLFIESKATRIEEGTADLYAIALDDHVLPVFGSHYYDALRAEDVQNWVDRALVSQYETRTGIKKTYSWDTVHGWYRMFRTMTREAARKLSLPRDPFAGVEFPPRPDKREAKSTDGKRLMRFLAEMKQTYPQHFALAAALAHTGLRFCHVSPWRWENLEEGEHGWGVMHIRAKYTRHGLGNVTRRKPAPKQYPLSPELMEVLREHHKRMMSLRLPGLAEGWIFPNANGKPRQPGGLYKAWRHCAEVAGITNRFTVHGTRYTLNDLFRDAGVTAEVKRQLIGHLTSDMSWHYSHVRPDEERAALAAVQKLVPLAEVGTQVGRT